MPINPSSLRSQQDCEELEHPTILPFSTAGQLAKNAPASAPLSPHQFSYLEDVQ